MKKALETTIKKPKLMETIKLTFERIECTPAEVKPSILQSNKFSSQLKPIGAQEFNELKHQSIESKSNSISSFEQ